MEMLPWISSRLLRSRAPETSRRLRRTVVGVEVAALRSAAAAAAVLARDGVLGGLERKSSFRLDVGGPCSVILSWNELSDFPVGDWRNNANENAESSRSSRLIRNHSRTEFSHKIILHCESKRVSQNRKIGEDEILPLGDGIQSNCLRLVCLSARTTSPSRPATPSCLAFRSSIYI